MKEKTVTCGDISIRLTSMKRGKYMEILRKHVQGNDLVEYSDSVVFFSIKEWNLKNEKGEPLPVTRANLNDYTTADMVDELRKAAEEVNGLTPEEKNLIEAACYSVGWGVSDYEKDIKYQERKTEKSGIYGNEYIAEYWILRHFGPWFYELPSDEAEGLCIVEDIVGRHERWVVEKAEYEAKRRR